PWERVKLQEQEFFAERDTEIATAPTAASRKKLIAKLEERNPQLFAEFLVARRGAEGVSFFLRESGAYALTGVGDINTYPVLAERDRSLLAGAGRLGVILPTGIATDATTAPFFRDLVEKGALVSLYDFENARPLFPGVHRSFKFCLLTLSGRERRIQAADFAFFVHDPNDLTNDGVRFQLSPEEIRLLNPNTGTCPVFRSRRDAEITLGIYRRVPVLVNENDKENGNPWGIKFMTRFHMSNDSHLFHTREELEADGWELHGNVFERSVTPHEKLQINHDVTHTERMLPLYEAKMIHHYDTRWATYEPDGTIRDVTLEEKRAGFAVLPRYWVHEHEVDKKLEGKWDKRWLLGWRDICRSTDERTTIATKLPRVAVGNKIPLALPDVTSDEASGLQAALASFVLDFASRQKMGSTTMNFFIFEQLPLPQPSRLAKWTPWIAERVDRLNSQRLDETVRQELRAELDALMFHVYGVSRDDADYILDTFPIVKRKDEAAYGEYRTKRLILEKYDALGRTLQCPSNACCRSTRA